MLLHEMRESKEYFGPTYIPFCLKPCILTIELHTGANQLPHNCIDRLCQQLFIYYRHHRNRRPTRNTKCKN